MHHDFDRLISRLESNASAAEGYEKYLFLQRTAPVVLDRPKDDIIQMWVADMQFAAPQAALDAMLDRLKHPIFGYTMNYDDQLYDVFHAWCQRRHSWSFPREQLVLSLGVIPALFGLVSYLCGPHDKVLTLSPSYGYFKHATVKSGRTLVTSPLINNDGHYEVDFKDFEEKAADISVKVFFLCLLPVSPAQSNRAAVERSRVAAPGGNLLQTRLEDHFRRNPLRPASRRAQTHATR
jgi:cysteine-S-conjugate beta-lyase